MIEVVARAKLTLSLRVTGVRDDGYHLIDAEMVALDLADRLEIAPDRQGLEIVEETLASAETAAPAETAASAETAAHLVSAPGERHAPATAPAAVPAGDDNLVAKALRLAGRSAFVRVHKRIPAGAGLGGGSADAAAILRWAGYRDLDGAASIGADVAFCLVGGRARVRGIGEIVEPLPFEAATFTLLTPPIHCSTPAVYRAWDELGGPRGDHGNDLEPAALVVAPELERYRDRLGDATGQRPRLAGSGSTWFVTGAFPGENRVVVRTIRADHQSE